MKLTPQPIVTSVKNHPEQTALSSSERKALADLEETFRQGARTPFEMGRVLQEIRDRRLYRGDFPRFSEYCEKKLDCSRSCADRLIGAWRVQALLTPIAKGGQ
jgi:hypothetical protein